MDTLITLSWSIPLAIFVFVLFYRLGKWMETKNFNDGNCKCGGRFKPFDVAVFYGSDGSRGYSCDKCGQSVFCSYNVDRGYQYRPLI